MSDHRVQIAANGMMVLPSSLRQHLHVEGGGQVVIREDHGQLILESVGASVARAQALVRQHAPTARNITEELVADRRAAADLE